MHHVLHYACSHNNPHLSLGGEGCCGNNLFLTVYIIIQSMDVVVLLEVADTYLIWLVLAIRKAAHIAHIISYLYQYLYYIVL